MKLRFVAPLLTLSAIVYPAHALALWQTNGVPLSTATNHQEWPAITTDGAAGAIVAWSDKRSGNFDVYVRRVNALGVVQWTPNGVPLCAVTGDQINVTIVSDGAGGAIVAWQDYRSSTNYNIYVQHVNASGLVQWAPNGIALCTADNDQRYPVPATDGAGGAIVAWDDARDSAEFDIYAQRINAAGVIQWMDDGVELCTQPFIQYLPAILSDGAGGAIVTWPDFRSSTDYDIYGQRVDGSGSTLWADDGVPICAALNNSAGQTMAPDGAGGAIVTWEDFRYGVDWDVFAQRIDAAGNVQWTMDGVPLCVIRGVQTTPTIVPDGSNGAIVTWWDIRSNIDYDIYVQRVNASGTALWTPHGVALCTADENQISPKIVSDGGAGAIVTWHDERSITSYDVYAQRIGPNGFVPTSVGDTPSFAGVSLSANFPNPFSDETSMELDLSVDASVEVEVHDVAGRLVRRVRSLHASAGLHRMSFDGRDGAGRPLASGVYFYSVHAGGETRTRKLIISR